MINGIFVHIYGGWADNYSLVILADSFSRLIVHVSILLSNFHNLNTTWFFLYLKSKLDLSTPDPGVVKYSVIVQKNSLLNNYLENIFLSDLSNIISAVS